MASSSEPMFIYNLPFAERKQLCQILDHHDKWEELGGIHMLYDVATLDRIGRVARRGQSPTNELLQHWETQNHTVLELFVLLSKMQHYQAMSILKPFVDSKYHRLIYEGEENFSRIFTQNLNKEEKNGSPSAPPVSSQASAIPVSSKSPQMPEKDMGIAAHNLYKPSTSPTPRPAKVTLPPIETKINNNEPTKVQNSPLPNQDKENTIPTYQRKLSDASTVSSTAEACTPLINYLELEAATSKWDRSCILGRGGFGTVFKGNWKNTQVAIKRLETQNKAASEELLEAQRQQSLRELKYLNSFRHDNILPLYGYSVGGDAPCLVYQFMPNGSLEDRLLCRQNSRPLSWSQRHNIATGIARGLQFLHSLADKPLVHGDIKSANILLDPYFEPKIGDFGLAREGPHHQYTHVKVSKVHGTRPYLPDELLRGKKFSTKVDTYSFGIVLFEIATGLRAYEESRPKKFLKDFVEQYNEALLYKLADAKAGPDEANTAPGLLALGKWCVKNIPSERPDMVIVLQRLDILATAREEAMKAHSLVRQNSLSPTTPYERQLLFDHMSQQRRLSVPSPVTTNATGITAGGRATPVLNSPPPVPVVQPVSQQSHNPHISVTPPTNNMRSISSAGSQERTVNEEVKTVQLPDSATMTPCDELPLISALGVTTPIEQSDHSNHSTDSSDN